jgi:hypothetical protein
MSMSRTANIVLALAVIVLTSAVVTFCAPMPRGELAPDVRPLIAIGTGLLILVYWVDAALTRRLIPFLRPAYVETQRQLSVVVDDQDPDRSARPVAGPSLRS